MLSTTQHPTLIFVHGFKGASIVDSKGELEWITAPKALGISKRPQIELPKKWVLNPAGTLIQQQTDNLRVRAPLWRVSGFYSVYAPFLSWCTRTRGNSFIEFAWDWRRDINEASESLLDLLQTLQTPSQIIGHSMGGLVSYSALVKAFQRNLNISKLIHSVVFAGTPFLPSCAFLEDMTPGSPLHTNYLPSCVSFTFPSIFSLFPVEGDFGNAETWINKKLGFFSSVENHTEENISHLRNTLLCARKFREVLSSQLPQEVCPPVSIIASSEHKTPSGIIADIKTAQIPTTKSEWNALPREKGDLRVGFESAIHIPNGLNPKGGIHLTKLSHVALLNDTNIVQLALNNLEYIANNQ